MRTGSFLPKSGMFTFFLCKLVASKVRAKVAPRFCCTEKKGPGNVAIFLEHVKIHLKI